MSLPNNNGSSNRVKALMGANGRFQADGKPRHSQSEGTPTYERVERAGQERLILEPHFSKDDVLVELQAGRIAQDKALKLLDLLEELETAERNMCIRYNPNKGTVSVDGLQRMPVTLYEDQWRILLAYSGKITDWLDRHHDGLAAAEKTGNSAK
jgi:hypothetical protein